jgi:hypothetical protein
MLAAAMACLLLPPLLFERYTFGLYLAGEPSYFVFSGARLWVFLASSIPSGLLAARYLLPARNYLTLPAMAGALLLLIGLLYSFCDARACYHAGPDGLGWLRLWVLLFASASMGIVAGTLLGRRETGGAVARYNVATTLLCATLAAVLLDYYPFAFLYGVPLDYATRAALLAYSATAPFFLVGAVAGSLSSELAGKKYPLFFVTAASLLVLLALFVPDIFVQPQSLWPLVVILAAGAATSMLGSSVLSSTGAGLGGHERRCRHALIAAAALSVFFLSAVHPFLDVPLDLGHTGVQNSFIVVPAPAAFYDGGILPCLLVFLYQAGRDRHRPCKLYCTFCRESVEWVHVCRGGRAVSKLLQRRT